MKLNPRAEDLAILFSTWVIFLLGCLGLGLLFDWAPVVVWGSLIFGALLLLESVGDFLYLSRTVILNASGCTFFLFGFQQTYSWEALEVRLCTGLEPRFHAGDPGGAGILLLPRTARYGRRLAPMTWCRWHHPLAAVFLRFPKQHIPSHIYQGFLADREELLALLQSFGVQVHA